jgi:dienelactone hydrolase
MPGRFGSSVAIAIALLVVACAWAVLLAMNSIQQAADEFGVGTTDLAEATLWYPVPLPSVVSRLKSAVSLGVDERDVPPATNGHPLPVLIYFGGWPATGIDNRELIRALVSQGFVVVAAKARDSSPPMDFSSAAAYADTVRRAETRVRLLAGEAVALVDSLESLNKHDLTGRFTGRLDLAGVGIFGYSFGGAVAAQAAWMDARFKAVLNVDGWSFGDAAVAGIKQPYLFISDAAPPPTQADVASADPNLRYTSVLTRADYPRLLHNLARNQGVFLQVAGTSHGSFVDRGRSARIRAMLGLGASNGAARARVQLILRSYALAFFRSHLQGIPSGLLNGPSSQFPEVHFGVRAPAKDAVLTGNPDPCNASRPWSGAVL